MSHFHNNALIGASGQGGYNLESSLRFRGSNSAYLEWTPASAGNLTTWTWSGWFKLSDLSSELEIFQGGITNYNDSHFRFEPATEFKLVMYDGTAQSGALIFNRKFRDPSAWYHLVVVWDSTNATSTNRFRAYINGERETSFSTETYPSLNAITSINKANKHLIGTSRTTGRFFNGYMTEINFVDGQALTADDFGSYDGATGVWKPKEYTGTYGTNGFYLPFKETQQATGFNTVLYTGNGGTQSITGVGFSPDFVWIKNRTTNYAHQLFDNVRGATNVVFSNLTNAGSIDAQKLQSFDADGFTYGTNVGGNASGENHVAWCWDAGSDNTTGSELVTNGTFDSGTTGWTNVNCSISGTNQKLNATYSSSGAYVYQEVTGLTVGQKYILSFQSSGSNDFIRILRDAQTEALGGTFISFLGGFVTTFTGLNQVFFEAPTSTVYINFNVPNGGTIIIDDISMKEISWDGSIPTLTKANSETGFSIITYKGNANASATIGHGLGTAPSMVIVKKLNNTANWAVWHQGLSSYTHKLYLNTDEAEATGGNPIDAAPTSSVLELSDSGNSNASDGTYVAYCFADVAGYSKMGSYTGNGSVGNSVTGLGFEPAFLLIKNATDLGGSGESWYLYDNARDPVDTRYHKLNPNGSSAESTSTVNNLVDFDSDGFTIQSTNAGLNYNGDTYIYMAFADTRDAQFNFDASGNKNNWTATSINSNASAETTYDIMNDVPTLTDEDTANFCVINPLDSPNTTVTEANLKATGTADYYGWRATQNLPSTGKYYWEIYVSRNSTVNVQDQGYGLIGDSVNMQSQFPSQKSPTVFYTGNGSVYVNNSETQTAPTAFSVGDTVGIAVDMDAGTVQFYLNNSAQGTAESLPSNTGYWLPGSYQSINRWCIANFGQRPFKYTPPTGFKKLNTYNLSNSTIKDGSQYFNSILYTGNGSTQTISGVGFQPDFAWIKCRSNTSSHALIDSVRGFKSLRSNSTVAEFDNTNFWDGFNSDGYNFIGNEADANTLGRSYVGWNWKASNAAAVTNTDGSITSQVSANPTSGFSIVTYTGTGANATVGHGLGVAPKMVIVKQRDGTNGWTVYHKELTDIYGSDYVIAFDANARFSSSTAFNNTSPNASTFTLGTGALTNSSGGTYVAYCFSEVEGFSKIGSFTGNSQSVNGPFIYTGFRPAFVLFKRTGAGSWNLVDSARTPYNNLTTGSSLSPDNISAESTDTTNRGDLLSNGFRVASGSTSWNLSGSIYIYMAFAENPFKNSLAR